MSNNDVTLIVCESISVLRSTRSDDFLKKVSAHKVSGASARLRQKAARLSTSHNSFSKTRR